MESLRNCPKKFIFSQYDTGITWNDTKPWGSRTWPELSWLAGRWELGLANPCTLLGVDLRDTQGLG
jgi:hypothetical protein